MPRRRRRSEHQEIDRTADFVAVIGNMLLGVGGRRAGAFAILLVVVHVSMAGRHRRGGVN